MKRVLEIAGSPHLTSGASVERIMFHVALALLPTSLFAIYVFGLAALITLLGAILACLATEHALCRLTGQPTTISDGSALVTGLLFGLVLPPALPLWMTVLGGVFAIAVGKFAFGGLGFNAFNPALVGRAFLMAAFPVAMTTWLAALAATRFNHLPASLLAAPFMSPSAHDVDAMSSATPLSAWKFSGEATSVTDLALGLTSGSSGETSALLIGLGGVYLVALRIVNWRIPAAIFATVGGISAVLNTVDPARFPDAGFMLLSGGLMLGAVFMATDLIASPLTRAGAWLYGALIGALTLAIRLWAGLPEGVMYAILIGNALAPHIDRWLRPTPYGAGSKAVPVAAPDKGNPP